MQVTPPAFPPVMIDMKDLNSAVNDLRRLLEGVLYNMPVLMSSDAVAELLEEDVAMDEECQDECECEGGEDEDEDEDEDEAEDEAEDEDEAEADDEEDYADMPPLVRLEPEPVSPPQTHSYFTRLQERLQNSFPSQRSTGVSTHTYFS